MPSLSAYHLTWGSLNLDVGYLFTAVPAKHSHCSLHWMWSISSQPLLLALDVGYLLTATAPDLGLEVSPLGCYCTVQPLLQSPLLRSTSPTLSVYAESFVFLSSKINFVCVNVCEFVKFNFQLCEQELSFLFHCLIGPQFSHL